MIKISEKTFNNGINIEYIFRVSAEIVAINDKGESAPFQVELDTPQPDNLQETSAILLSSEL